MWFPRLVVSAHLAVLVALPASGAELALRGDSLRFGTVGENLALPNGGRLEIESLARLAHELNYASDAILIFRLDQGVVLILDELPIDQFEAARKAGFRAASVDLANATRFAPADENLDISLWLDRPGRLLWRPVDAPALLEFEPAPPTADEVFADRFQNAASGF